MLHEIWPRSMIPTGRGPESIAHSILSVGVLLPRTTPGPCVSDGPNDAPQGGNGDAPGPTHAADRGTGDSRHGLLAFRMRRQAGHGARRQRGSAAGRSVGGTRRKARSPRSRRRPSPRQFGRRRKIRSSCCTPSAGDIKIKLLAGKAPQTVDNFLSNYAERQFYDETIFHHVEAGSMLIGGGYAERLASQTDADADLQRVAQWSFQRAAARSP